MGDAPGISLLSLIPLAIIVASVAAAVTAWRSRQRSVRTVVALVLMALGAMCVFSAVGVLFSLGGGVLIGVVGAVLLIAEYGSKRTA